MQQLKSETKKSFLNNHSDKQQDTIYIDKNGKQISTNKHNLFGIDTTEIVQIGFFENQKKEIQVAIMPPTIKKVPKQLPAAITSLKNMFSGATIFNQDLSNWDTSNVTNMSYMFFNAQAFNSNIASWNTGKVTDMSQMFYDARSFNSNIADWVTGKVTNMSKMFFQASSFNQNLGKWNVSNVTNMNAMFSTMFFFLNI